MATEQFTGLPFQDANMLQTDLEQNAFLALVGPSLAGYATHNITAGEETAGEVALSYIENWMAFLTIADPDTLLAGPIDIVLPANFPMRVVANATTQTITLKKEGQTGVELEAGGVGLYVSGSTDVVAFAVAGGEGGGATTTTDIVTEASAFTAVTADHAGTSRIVLADGDVTFDNAEAYAAGDTFNISATAGIELIEDGVTLTPPALGTLALDANMTVTVLMTSATAGRVIGQTVPL